MTWTPRVTVAAVIERNGRFLMVEEESDGKAVFNQPAGHLDPGESPVQAAIRETLEETAWHFQPVAVVSVYLWTYRVTGVSYFRVAFCGDCTGHEPDRPLDHGILRAVWLTREELPKERLRSPMVLRTLDDYLAGRRYPLDLIAYLDADPEV